MVRVPIILCGIAFVFNLSLFEGYQEIAALHREINPARERVDAVDSILSASRPVIRLLMLKLECSIAGFSKGFAGIEHTAENGNEW